jgi:hypothetical protein
LFVPGAYCPHAPPLNSHLIIERASHRVNVEAIRRMVRFKAAWESL